MNCTRYLCVKHTPGRWQAKPATRMTTKLPTLAANEIAIKLEIDIPDTLFTRPSLEAKVTVPKDQVNRPVIDAVVQDNIVQEVQKQLGVEMTLRVVEAEVPSD